MLSPFRQNNIMAKQILTKTSLPRREPKEEKKKPDWAVRLKQLREMHYDTAIEFAEKLGLSQQRYSNYENGDREPTIDVWHKIAQDLKVTVDRIMFGPGERH
jgi:DNA-binding XRE family transcriptional regulator